MKERSEHIHEFGNLIIRAATPSDILIMKSVTARDKDKDDIIAIINKTKPNWNVIIEEIKEQVRLGNEEAILGLGEKLEKLVNSKAINVPQGVSDKLWKLFKEQVKKRNLSRKK